MKKLRDILIAMTENLAFQLRRANKVAAVVSVRVRYSDFQTHEKQVNIGYTAADHILITTVLELFKKLYQRRVLVRLVGIRLGKIVSGGYQINLLEDSEELIKLYQAMDHIRNRFGDRAVMRTCGMDARTIGRGNPFTGGPPPLLANRRR
jgi:DNA polymerase-4